ncbi:MAG: DUF3341 domain-containing protein [Armatimonadetes bacterium]|nr:DUF3341 domain-containing protein [Armatimonadota bacterium]
MNHSIYGIIAQFSNPEQLLEAVRRARKEGYRRMEAYTPFAVDGLADELECRDDRVPVVVFICGVVGAGLGLFLQYWVSSVDLPLNVGGRPDFSWPSFIPITFEIGILGAAFGALIGMLVMNGLPRPHHPIFDAPGFEAVTRDKFFLCIEAEDPLFDRGKTKEFLETVGPEAVSEVPE